MRLFALIFSVTISWGLVAAPVFQKTLDANISCFEVHKLPQFDVSLPEGIVSNFEKILRYGFIEYSIPIFKQIFQTVPFKEPHTLFSSLPPLYLKLRVFRN